MMGGKIAPHGMLDTRTRKLEAAEQIKPPTNEMCKGELDSVASVIIQDCDP